MSRAQLKKIREQDVTFLRKYRVFGSNKSHIIDNLCNRFSLYSDDQIRQVLSREDFPAHIHMNHMGFYGDIKQETKTILNAIKLAYNLRGNWQFFPLVLQLIKTHDEELKSKMENWQLENSEENRELPTLDEVRADLADLAGEAIRNQNELKEKNRKVEELKRKVEEQKRKKEELLKARENQFERFSNSLKSHMDHQREQFDKVCQVIDSINSIDSVMAKEFDELESWLLRLKKLLYLSIFLILAFFALLLWKG